MGKFRDSMARFFYGRNGPDNLYRFISWTAVVLLLVQFIVSFFSAIAYYIIFGTVVALIAYGLFRVLSKNVYERQAENRKYLAIKGNVVRWFKMNVNRFKDRKTKAYRRCPKCKTMLKLPRVKGSHSVRCPKCQNKFNVKI